MKRFIAVTVLTNDGREMMAQIAVPNIWAVIDENGYTGIENRNGMYKVKDSYADVVRKINEALNESEG